MVELSVLDVRKLIHLFVESLTLQVSSNCNKKRDKINFISCKDISYQTNLELLKIGENSKDIATNSILDITDVQSVRHFIETQTKFLDKFFYLNNIPILTCHLDHINKKIVQKIHEADKNMEKCKTKCNKNKFLQKQKLKRVTTENNQQIYDANVTEILLVPEQIHKDLLFVKRTNACLKKDNFAESITEHTWQETMLNEEYLQLYINNLEFIKKVHVTLYVASKTLHDVKYHPDIPHNERILDYRDILMLCEHAILCFIDPSKKAFVYMEDNLSVIIQKHLLQGCVYHFDFKSDTKDYYSALLILSKWAKPLIRHSDTTILRAISSILRCNDTLKNGKRRNNRC
ncbi:uncharacterized protein LOC126852367 isoform X1 [Cataglyphis hispanica]|uniref:uncharacterized protein LOC126852367 isoform X1 n=1 Tax=Cataglyphis hispanica TaxID=1086592 RepID=UPI002180336B|nr:uncharacterized protein LOC126852367 isoform X1 [Cataglyphis hispanica]